MSEQRLPTGDDILAHVSRVVSEEAASEHGKMDILQNDLDALMLRWRDKGVDDFVIFARVRPTLPEMQSTMYRIFWGVEANTDFMADVLTILKAVFNARTPDKEVRTSLLLAALDRVNNMF